MKFNQQLNAAILSCLTIMINSGRISADTLTNNRRDIEQLKKLPQLPLCYFDELACELGPSFIQLDLEMLAEKLQLVDIPIECQNFLKIGASNKIMMQYFGVNHNKCSEWRKRVKIDKKFLRRALTENELDNLWSDIAKIRDNPLKKGNLMQLAKNHKINISTIHSEIQEFYVRPSVT